jgi:hypothetical protein
MGLTIEGLALDDPIQFFEQLGDPVADFGGTPVPAPRQALRHAISIPTYGPNAGGVLSTLAQNLTVRRQLRSLLNNSPYKLAGLYMVWVADPEQSGWYVPDMGQLTDGQGQAGLATGWFQVMNVVWRKAGARRTHRRAAQIMMLSYLGGTNARDYLQRVYSTDFSALTPLAVTYLPPGVVDIVNSSSYAAVTGNALSTGFDGTAPVVITGQANLTVCSYEQPETNQFNGGVIAYDRLGANTSTTEANWQQVWGPDWPWYWPTSETANPDTPVLENGQCRVRYDATNTPGWRIDTWSGSAWVEQCKVWILRGGYGVTQYPESVLQSAGLEEYTPERAVMKCVMTAAGDATSREIIFITLQRGWSGPRFEVYPALLSPGNQDGASIVITPAAVDADDSAFCLVGGAGVNDSTALGTGHTGLFSGVTLFNANSSDNGAGFLRSAAPGSGGLAAGGQISVAVLVGSTAGWLSANTNAYGSNRNTLMIQSQSTGYVSAHLGFSPVFAHQVMECENMTLASGTSSTADATASGAYAATATRTSQATHVTQTGWPDTAAGVFRVFARVRVSAGTGSVLAATGLTLGSATTTTSTSYVWLDLGDINSSGTLAIRAWISTGSGTIYVDRIEAYLRSANSRGYAPAGTQDLGQSALYNSQVIGGIVSRA